MTDGCRIDDTEAPTLAPRQFGPQYVQSPGVAKMGKWDEMRKEAGMDGGDRSDLHKTGAPNHGAPMPFGDGIASVGVEAVRRLRDPKIALPTKMEEQVQKAGRNGNIVIDDQEPLEAGEISGLERHIDVVELAALLHRDDRHLDMLVGATGHSLDEPGQILFPSWDFHGDQEDSLHLHPPARAARPPFPAGDPQVLTQT